MRAIGFFAGMSPELSNDRRLPKQPNYRTTERPNYRTTELPPAFAKATAGPPERSARRRKQPTRHILEDKGMRYRLLPFRPLGWIALALGLLLSPAPARATESLGRDAPFHAEQTSGEGRAPGPSRVKLDHHRLLAPFALYSLRVASHGASDASESSGKDDVAVGAIPGRVQRRRRRAPRFRWSSRALSRPAARRASVPRCGHRNHAASGAGPHCRARRVHCHHDRCRARRGDHLRRCGGAREPGNARSSGSDCRRGDGRGARRSV